MKIKCKVLVSIIGLLFIVNAYGQKTNNAENDKTQLDYKMMDPSIDDQEKEWCYLGKSTTVIGVPFVPEPVQVTYDGAIYTKNAELCFFYGEKNTPFMARQKTFFEGWIPIVHYDFQDGDIVYDMEMFSAIVPPLESDNVVQFAKISMRNIGNDESTGVIVSAIRGSGEINRKGDSHWNMTSETKLSFDANSFIRDGMLVYTFSDGGKRWSTFNSLFKQPFTGATHELNNRKETGLVKYCEKLKPGESFSAYFKMPRSFISNAEGIKAVKESRYDTFREKTIAYWENKIEGKMSFSIPESRVNSSYKAALVHLALATRGNKGQGNRQGSGLPYDGLFLNDYMDMLMAYDLNDMPEMAEPNVDWLLKKQHESGMFIDIHNRGNDDIVTSHGQGLFSLAYHYVITRNNEYAKRVYPAVRKAVELIINDHKTNKYGLIRSSIPYDAPMLTGHHACHNLFALTALQTSIRMAQLMGEEEDATAWLQAQKTFKKAILKAINNSIEKEGYITSGLYDWSAGWVQGKKGSVNEYPNQDWENNLLIFPSEIMEPGDNRVANTLSTIRKRKYREGVMTYRNGMHIHQYITLNQANQYLAMGDQENALSDLYHVLLHNGSTHEGFENLVVPWTRLVDPNCPPPHAWAAAKTALFIRNMMLREHGGEGGIHNKARNLFLFSLISPTWIKPGNKLEISNAVSEMGTVSASMTFTKDGANVTIAPDFHTSPAKIALTIPYFVELESCDAGTKDYEIKDGVIFLPADVTKVKLKWKEKNNAHAGNFQKLLKMYRSEYGLIRDRNRYRSEKPKKPILNMDEKNYPAEVFSFDLVRKAFMHEYKRRADAYKNEGGVLEYIVPPAQN